MALKRFYRWLTGPIERWQTRAEEGFEKRSKPGVQVGLSKAARSQIKSNISKEEISLVRRRRLLTRLGIK